MLVQTVSGSTMEVISDMPRAVEIVGSDEALTYMYMYTKPFHMVGKRTVTLYNANFLASVGSLNYPSNIRTQYH